VLNITKRYFITINTTNNCVIIKEDSHFSVFLVYSKVALILIKHCFASLIVLKRIASSTLCKNTGLQVK
jgi:hypothetical protein